MHGSAMKKPVSRPRKAPPRKRRPSARKTLFGGVDIGALRRLLANEFPFDEDSLEGMLEELLSAQLDDPHDLPSAQRLSDLGEALNQTRLDAAGGDAWARETMKNVHAMIDEAAGRDGIHLGVLFMLGRLFAGAEIDIGDAARAAVGRTLDAESFDDPAEDAYRAFVQPMVSAGKGDPFDLCEEIGALIAIFPLRYKVAFVERLAGETNALARQAVVGFLLDRDEPLAQAAIRGLAAAAARGGLDHKCRRWIEIIRPWVTPARRRSIESALPPAGRTVPRAVTNVIRTIASVCDGSGASAVWTTFRSGSRYTIASVMIKPKGAAASMMLENLSKSDVTRIERAAGSSAPTSEVSLATAARLLRLALGCNVSFDAPPPFALVPIVEAMGLDTLVPDPAAAAEIIESTLAEVPDRDHAETIRQAHESVAGGSFADNWFEAGEDIDMILTKTDSIDHGARALLESYLPGRRAFWATQCARSALALKDGAAAGDDTWRNLALVGRDILRDIPVGEISLMREIAEKSAAFYFAQR
jgi:hypothetical protein